jgi:hypothetical protein
MKSSSPSKSRFKVRVIRGQDTATNIQKIAWPSIDKPADGAAPIPLPRNPVVELVHNADGKDHILVTCTCGKRIEITCETAA